MTEEKLFDFSRFSDRQLVSLLAQVYTEVRQRRERVRRARARHPQFTEASTAMRYRNPENPSETWSGKGPMPTWMREALASGHDLASLVEVD